MHETALDGHPYREGCNKKPAKPKLYKIWHLRIARIFLYVSQPIWFFPGLFLGTLIILPLARGWVGKRLNPERFFFDYCFIGPITLSEKLDSIQEERELKNKRMLREQNQ